MLCDPCRSIFEGEGIFDRSYFRSDLPKRYHHPSLASFQRAVDAGCYICLCTRKGISKDQKWFDSDRDDLYTAAHIDSCGREPDLVYVITIAVRSELNVSSEGEGPVDLHFQHFEAVPRKDIGQLFPYDGLIGDLQSLPSLEFIKSSIRSCDKTHEICKENRRRGDRFPTRLVELNAAGDLSWKVVEFDDKCPPSVQYMTLSHVWTQNPGRPELTGATRPYMTRGHPVSELPASFQEAIRITLDLGIKYIWVDCLCILQDQDYVDWDREALRMYSYYTNSYLNLASLTFSGDFSDPTKRDPRRFIDTITTKWSDGLHLNGERCIVSHGFIFGNIRDDRFFRRGWIFQERILSSKIVYFGREQYFWHCPQTIASQTFPNGHAPLPFYRWELRQAYDELLRAPNYGRKNWFQAVNEYSRCKLTYDEDKLAGIAGLARLFQKETRDDYVAGLWMSNLIECLAWRCKAPGTRQSSNLFPSWSWASVNASVESPYFPFRPEHSLVRAISVEATDLLGTPLRRTDKSAGHPLSLCGFVLPIEINYDGYDSKELTGNFKLISRTFTGEIYWDTKSPYRINFVRGIFLLPLAMYCSSGTIHGVYFLILVPNMEDQNTYTRIGQIHYDRSCPMKGHDHTQDDINDEEDIEIDHEPDGTDDSYQSKSNSRLRRAFELLLRHIGIPNEVGDLFANGDVDAIEEALRHQSWISEAIFDNMKKVTII